MKQVFCVASVLVVCLVLTSVGCGTKKAASSDEAIANADAMETIEEKVDYLIKQAKAFYNSEQYKDAAESAQHVLTKLEKDSEEAREILEKARKEMTSKVQDMIENIKEGFRDKGK